MSPLKVKWVRSESAQHPQGNLERMVNISGTHSHQSNSNTMLSFSLQPKALFGNKVTPHKEAPTPCVPQGKDRVIGSWLLASRVHQLLPPHCFQPEANLKHEVIPVHKEKQHRQ